MGNGFILEKLKYKREKNSWVSFRIYQLISADNPALFELNCAWLALLILKKKYFIQFSKYEIIAHWVPAFFIRNKLSTAAKFQSIV